VKHAGLELANDMLAGVSSPLECRDSPRVRWPSGFTDVQARAGGFGETSEAFLPEPGLKNMFSHWRPARVAGADEHYFVSSLRHGNNSPRRLIGLLFTRPDVAHCKPFYGVLGEATGSCICPGAAWFRTSGLL
jgi:hypothetical protein